MKKKIACILFIFSTISFFAIDNKKAEINGCVTCYYSEIETFIRENPSPNSKKLGKVYIDDEIYVNKEKSTNNFFYCYIPKLDNFGFCNKEGFVYKRSFSSILNNLIKKDTDTIDMVKRGHVQTCHMTSLLYWLENVDENTRLEIVSLAESVGCSYTDYETSVLLVATQKNYTNIVEFLVTRNEAKKIINSSLQQYAPPLFWAMMNGNLEIAELLLNYGADPNFSTVSDNPTAFDALEEFVESKRISTEKAQEFRNLLIDYGYERKNSCVFKLEDNLKAKENLRFRDEPNLSGKTLITIKKGSSVKVLKLGKYENLDGLNGRWLYVEVSNNTKDINGNPIKSGTTGWCYGGYLE